VPAQQRDALALTTALAGVAADEDPFVHRS
jgi:hypothetical protein